MEIAHLHKAAELLKKYEGKEWQEVIPCGEFPEPLSLHENIDYVRSILKNTVQFTGDKEDYIRVEKLPDDANFFKWQKLTNPKTDIVPSHNVIEKRICRAGKDYRFEVAPNPVEELRSRTKDNTTVGRKANAAESTDFECN
jgi:hypothetical protein